MKIGIISTAKASIDDLCARLPAGTTELAIRCTDPLRVHVRAYAHAHRLLLTEFLPNTSPSRIGRMLAILAYCDRVLVLRKGHKNLWQHRTDATKLKT